MDNLYDNRKHYYITWALSMLALVGSMFLLGRATDYWKLVAQIIQDACIVIAVWQSVVAFVLCRFGKNLHESLLPVVFCTFFVPAWCFLVTKTLPQEVYDMEILRDTLSSMTLLTTSAAVLTIVPMLFLGIGFASVVYGITHALRTRKLNRFFYSVFPLIGATVVFGYECHLCYQLATQYMFV